ncbi:hypothetical protein FE257_009156 [Aspergillus nanangensis]|uniref:Zn(2)-C6 fungal-type domain-containing protein n=1 Tax=Aspergillus nanangensis TaxID=2582783 RepID=A0AAD4GT15_ASPNN|nr:hypothetical protein FE257_009156 [Aspergillus nanangensis]
MRPPLTKRACDECITRKVKCSGAWPCETCTNASKRVTCTYLKPARRRGPKVRQPAPQLRRPSNQPTTDDLAEEEDDEEHDPGDDDPGGSGSSSSRPKTSGMMIPSTVLASVVRFYRDASYSVWPVVNAEALLQRLLLSDGQIDSSTYCLATALCSATMAQLQLAPLVDMESVDSSVLAAECMRVREESNYRENPDARSVLVSFFMHVYHAKINRRNSAMMFIQEAISGARLLRLDDDPEVVEDPGAGGDDVIENPEVLFTLLWVSERGYAMHLGLTPSYSGSIRLPTVASANMHVQGLVELARLFAAFDGVSIGRSSATQVSATSLAQTEGELSVLSFGQGGNNKASTRLADYFITKEWMRTIIWQEALSRQLLSSSSYVDLMTFRFPALVSRDLLYELRGFTESDLLPLGRDQLLKCFEVANSLADTVLYTASRSSSPNFEVGPQDFLHALYQRILPFLEQDELLKSILHAKTAEALVMAPARLLNPQPREESTIDKIFHETDILLSDS